MKYFCWEKNSFGEWSPCLYSENPKDLETVKSRVERTTLRPIPENLSEAIQLYASDKPAGAIRFEVTDE